MVVANYVLLLRGVNWLGGHDKVVNRHDTLGHRFLQIAQIAIAAQHDIARFDLRLGCFYEGWITLFDGFDLGLFKNARTCTDRKAGQAQHKLKRVHMTAAHIKRAAVIGGRIHQMSTFVRFQHADFIVAVFLRHDIYVSLVVRVVAFAVDGMHDAVIKTRMHIFVGAQTTDKIDRLCANVPKLAGVAIANHHFEVFLIAALPHADLPAAAPRRPKADTLGVQHNHIIAAFCQMIGRRHPCKACTNDTDIAVQRAFGGWKSV